ncbi:hypothetical protein GS538_20405 [Rhodococcus hoagii]|nr:hypothetical protein [Prescottella equi]NKS71558.1 hypothetical protein [Prescottella equi]
MTATAERTTLVQTVVHGRDNGTGDIIWDTETRRTGLVPASNRDRIIRREKNEPGTIESVDGQAIIFRTFPTSTELADHYTQIHWDTRQPALV